MQPKTKLREQKSCNKKKKQRKFHIYQKPKLKLMKLKNKMSITCNQA